MSSQGTRAFLKDRKTKKKLLNITIINHPSNRGQEEFLLFGSGPTSPKTLEPARHNSASPIKLLNTSSSGTLQRASQDNH